MAIPDNAADKTVPKARGLVRLPGHIAWSPPYVYDLDDRPQRCRAYARVMSEGLDADILGYIDIDALVEMWDEIHLAPHVRERWRGWLIDRGLLS